MWDRYTKKIGRPGATPDDLLKDGIGKAAASDDAFLPDDKAKGGMKKSGKKTAKHRSSGSGDMSVDTDSRSNRSGSGRSWEFADLHEVISTIKDMQSKAAERHDDLLEKMQELKDKQEKSEKSLDAALIVLNSILLNVQRIDASLEKLQAPSPEVSKPQAPSPEVVKPWIHWDVLVLDTDPSIEKMYAHLIFLNNRLIIALCNFSHIGDA